MNNFDQDYKLVIHLDNASYHKSKNPSFLDMSSQLTQEQIAEWILKNSPAEYGYDTLEDLQDENGDLLAIDDLKWIVNNFCPNHPDKITELIKSYDPEWEVEFTAPYWCHVCPVELLWNNQKLDYRGWDTESKKGRVNESVKTFMEKVTSRDVEGFYRHTDEFCFKINDKDEAFLKSYELEL